MKQKHIQKIITFVLLIGTLLGCLSACDQPEQDDPEPSYNQTDVTGTTATGDHSANFPTPDTGDTDENNGGNNGGNNSGNDDENEDAPIDYASLLKLDMNSSTAKQIVTVKTYIDGDTTHFHIPESMIPNSDGVLKARYMAVNTPESTGKIEEWGKAASNFTKSKLSSATSILVESETEKWEEDSTGSRYMVWVWYKESDDSDWRSLNVELLQNGLAIPSNSANNRYGTTCTAAIQQARKLKLKVYSDEQDPDFYYGEAQVITLKELRCNLEKYNGTKVAFTGVITVNYNNGVYVESYDDETAMWYGIYVYYGFGMNGTALDILSVGNESRIVGTVSYYEAGGTYQVSGLSYRVMKPDDPSNIKKLSDGHSPAYFLTDADTFANGAVSVPYLDEDGKEASADFRYAELAVGSSIRMQGLKVVKISTTTNEESSQKGAMTLTCEFEGIRIRVRTAVLRDSDGNLITASAFEGKTIDVCGIIDFYMNDYQIKVFSMDNITFQES